MKVSGESFKTRCGKGAIALSARPGRPCHIVGVFAAAVFAAVSVSAADVSLHPDGAVSLGEVSFTPMAILPGWRSAAVKGGYKLGADRAARFRFEDHGAKILEAATSLVQLDGGRLRLDCVFTASEPCSLLNIGVTMSLPAKAVEGGEWRADAQSGVFRKPESGIRLGGGKFSTLAFTPPGCASAIRLSTTNEISYHIQDSSQWGGGYTIRIGRLGAWSPAKGDAFSFSLLLESDEVLKAEHRMPYVVTCGGEWVPIDYRRDIAEGSALDFSSMGFTDAPAGKHGWLRNVGGHFEFEDLPGRPQRFYGVNLCFTANFPDHALADTLVTRFRRLGYNSVRLHHHDGGTVEGSADGLSLNAEQMDRFDYLAAAAIRAGLYLTTDLYVSRKVKWRDIGVDRDGTIDTQHFKALCAVYEPAFENWAAYAKNLLLHENRYTGRRYVDEPALPLISLVNEGGFFMGWTRGVRDDPRVVASWSGWLAGRRAKDPAFAEGMSGDRLPANFWDPKTQPVIAQWTGELEAKMVARMKAYLKSLGSKALLTNDNCGPHHAALQRATADYDYIDDHFYVDHPGFPEKHWSLPSTCPNVNPLLGGKPIAPSGQAFTRMLDKPFTVTEWNFSGPGRYRGVGGILAGAMAALQDWDGMWRFAYSHSRGDLGDADVRSPGYFDLASDPLSQAGERACLCLFMRRDIAPFVDGVALWDTPESASSCTNSFPAAPACRDVAWRMRAGSCLSPEGAGGLRVVRREQVGGDVGFSGSASAEAPLRLDRARGAFTIDTPRTCGGFAPDERIDAGPLCATIRGAPATVWASSLDGAAIPASRHILLSHVTDVQGEGTEFADERMQTTLKWGRRPLVRIGSADVALALSDPSGLAVYEIDTAGRRRREIPSAVENGRLSFAVSTSGPDGGRLHYEVAVRQM